MLLLAALQGCAAGSNTDPGTSTGVGAATGTSGTGGIGAGGTGGVGASTAGTGGVGAVGGAGGSIGGAGGEGGQGACSGGCPQDWWDVDGNPLTGTCGCEYNCTKLSDDDPIDPNFEDSNCDGGDGLVEQCVYVSTSLGSSSGAGTRQSPMDTINNGIAKAQSSSVPSVCVSGELYNEQVTVISGINVYGGFDHANAEFAFRRTASAITTVNATGTVFYAPLVNQETHLEGFTINALTPSAGGASTYGVRLVAGTGELFVRYNIITAGHGQAGDDGDDGTAHADPQAPSGNPGSPGAENSCNGGAGGPQPSCVEYGGKGGDGGCRDQDGQTGLQGTDGQPGGQGGEGLANCLFGDETHGDDGGPALTSGQNGSVIGSGGASLGTITAGLYTPADGTDGSAGTNGKGGSGGGGGGGQDDIFGTVCDYEVGGGGGSGGCGGLGGDFGRGGQGGGGSFAVFAAGGIIRVTDNALTTGHGGDGGQGGTGQAGQTGGPGGSGGNAADDAGSGGNGGTGSAAGHGAPGGGGGGGPAACLAYGIGVAFTFQANTSCVVTGPGGGGPAATNPASGATSTAGQSGASGQTLQVL